MGGDIGGTGGRSPQKFEVGDVRPPNIWSSVIASTNRKHGNFVCVK